MLLELVLSYLNATSECAANAFWWVDACTDPPQLCSCVCLRTAECCGAARSRAGNTAPLWFQSLPRQRLRHQKILLGFCEPQQRFRQGCLAYLV